MSPLGNPTPSVRIPDNTYDSQMKEQAELINTIADRVRFLDEKLVMVKMPIATEPSVPSEVKRLAGPMTDLVKGIYDNNEKLKEILNHVTTIIDSVVI